MLSICRDAGVDLRGYPWHFAGKLHFGRWCRQSPCPPCLLQGHNNKDKNKDKECLPTIIYLFCAALPACLPRSHRPNHVAEITNVMSTVMYCVSTLKITY